MWKQSADISGQEFQIKVQHLRTIFMSLIKIALIELYLKLVRLKFQVSGVPDFFQDSKIKMFRGAKSLEDKILPCLASLLSCIEDWDLHLPPGLCVHIQKTEFN